MTNSQHLNIAHRMIRRRPEPGVIPQEGAGGAGQGGGAGGQVLPGDPSPSNTPSSTPSAPPTSSSAQSPPPTSSQASPSQPASTSANNDPPTSSSSPTNDSTTQASSKTTTTSATSSTSVSASLSSTSKTSTPHLPSITAAPTVVGNGNVGLGQSSFANIGTTDVTTPGSTVIADPDNTSGASKVSSGTIVGAVIGTLLGLGLFILCVMVLLRRVRRARRRRARRQHESDFGTFNRSALVKEKEPSIVPDMNEKSHTVAPSLTGEGMSAAVGTAVPPSQAMAAANSSASAAQNHTPLQERPKYVFGQTVPDGTSEEDVANGVYSSEPVAQTSYNPEAYGNYARYEDPNGGYQDAQREYQAQQGYQGYYDQNASYATDQQGYAVGGYDQQAYAVDGQYAQYDYSAQHAQYAADPSTHQVDANGYQQPHPYANNARGPGHDAAYGGM